MGGLAHLLNNPKSLSAFRTKYGVHDDVGIEYYHESDILLRRIPKTVFIPLIAVLKGEVGLPLSPHQHGCHSST